MKGHIPILPCIERAHSIFVILSGVSNGREKNQIFNVILVFSSKNGSPLSLSQVELLFDLVNI